MLLQEKSWRVGVAHKTAQVSIINLIGCCCVVWFMDQLKATVQISFSRFLLYQAWCLVQHICTIGMIPRREENGAFLAFYGCPVSFFAMSYIYIIVIVVILLAMYNSRTNVYLLHWPSNPNFVYSLSKLMKCDYLFESKMLPWWLPHIGSCADMNKWPIV